MNKRCLVENSWFENFHVSSNGGAFCVDNIYFDISCCFFTNNSCGSYGSCFYCTKTFLTLKKSYFFLCWSQAKRGDVFGNVGYLSENSVTVENIEILKCGKNENECSDSALYFEKGIIKPSYINASFNYGFEGSASFTARNAYETSIAKYINVVNGRDESMLQFAYKSFTVQYTNLINCSECSGTIILGTEGISITLEKCIIWNTGKKEILRPANVFVPIQTFCDREFNPLPKTESCSSYIIIINKNCPKKDIKIDTNSIFTLTPLKFTLLFIIIF